MAGKKEDGRVEGLSAQISVETDSADSDVSSHIGFFLKSFSKDIALPEIDLLSVDGAKKSLELLNETKDTLDKKLDIARKLRRLA